MVEPVCELINAWNQNGLNVKHVRLDNAGENVLLQQRANGVDWRRNLNFEFTGARTPQRNYLAELAFSALWGRV